LLHNSIRVGKESKHRHNFQVWYNAALFS